MALRPDSRSGPAGRMAGPPATRGWVELIRGTTAEGDPPGKRPARRGDPAAGGGSVSRTAAGRAVLPFSALRSARPLRRGSDPCREETACSPPARPSPLEKDARALPARPAAGEGTYLRGEAQVCQLLRQQELFCLGPGVRGAVPPVGAAGGREPGGGCAERRGARSGARGPRCALGAARVQEGRGPVAAGWRGPAVDLRGGRRLPLLGRPLRLGLAAAEPWRAQVAAAGQRRRPACQRLLAEAQQLREVADVADGEAQRLDLGQALPGGRHGGGQVAAQGVQGLGQAPHAELLALAGALALPLAQPGPAPALRRPRAGSPRRAGAGALPRSGGAARGLGGRQAAGVRRRGRGAAAVAWGPAPLLLRRGPEGWPGEATVHGAGSGGGAEHGLPGRRRRAALYAGLRCEQWHLRAPSAHQSQGGEDPLQEALNVTLAASEAGGGSSLGSSHSCNISPAFPLATWAPMYPPRGFRGWLPCAFPCLPLPPAATLAGTARHANHLPAQEEHGAREGLCQRRASLCHSSSASAIALPGCQGQPCAAYHRLGCSRLG